MNIDPAIVATLLTAAGATVGAAVIWALIDAAKNVGLGGVISGHERVVALALAIGVVTVATVVGLQEAPPRYHVDLVFVLGAAVAVYGMWRLALATHDDVSRKVNSITGPSE